MIGQSTSWERRAVHELGEVVAGLGHCGAVEGDGDRLGELGLEAGLPGLHWPLESHGDGPRRAPVGRENDLGMDIVGNLHLALELVDQCVLRPVGSDGAERFGIVGVGDGLLGLLAQVEGFLVAGVELEHVLGDGEGLVEVALAVEVPAALGEGIEVVLALFSGALAAGVHLALLGVGAGVSEGLGGGVGHGLGPGPEVGGLGLVADVVRAGDDPLGVVAGFGELAGLEGLLGVEEVVLEEADVGLLASGLVVSEGLEDLLGTLGGGGGDVDLGEEAPAGFLGRRAWARVRRARAWA